MASIMEQSLIIQEKTGNRQIEYSCSSSMDLVFGLSQLVPQLVSLWSKDDHCSSLFIFKSKIQGRKSDKRHFSSYTLCSHSIRTWENLELLCCYLLLRLIERFQSGGRSETQKTGKSNEMLEAQGPPEITKLREQESDKLMMP